MSASRIRAIVAGDARHEGGRPAVSVARSAPGTLFANRALDALAKSVLCFALAHVAILVADAAIRGDASGLNVFTMLEAQRFWPALAEGAARWWSLAFGFAVYGAVFATLARRRSPRAALPAALERRLALARTASVATATPHAGTNGVATNGATANGVHAGDLARISTLAASPTRVTLAAGIAALLGGLALHVVSLVSIERFVRVFPPVPDVVHALLPYVNFGVPGELAYAAFMLAMVLVVFRTQRPTVPAILAMLGVFYAVRGLFLFLLPIGIPPTAPPLSERFVFWPFAGHAYFPGGHTGMMTVLSLSVVSRRWRRAFLVATFAFAAGTLLARTHYSADALGGWLVGYAVVLWGRRRFGARAGGIAARREASRPPAARQNCEA